MRSFLMLSAIYLFAPQLAGAGEGEFEDIRRALGAKMPEVTLGDIRKLPYADLYEVQANGIDVFYADSKGEVALFGNLVDLQTRANLSEQRKQELLIADSPNCRSTRPSST